jgi:sulfur relay protein TusB/DsrH
MPELLHLIQNNLNQSSRLNTLTQIVTFKDSLVFLQDSVYIIFELNNLEYLKNLNIITQNNLFFIRSDLQARGLFERHQDYLNFLKIKCIDYPDLIDLCLKYSHIQQWGI